MACVRSERPSAFRGLTGKNGLHNGRQLRRADRVSSRVPGVGLQPGPELGRFSDGDGGDSHETARAGETYLQHCPVPSQSEKSGP